MKFNKSKYKISKKSKAIKITYFFILCGVIFAMIFSKSKYNNVVGYLLLNLIYLSYFLFSYRLVKHNIISNNVLLNVYSTRLLWKYRNVMYIYIISIFLYTIISVYEKITYNFNIPYWVWFGMLIPILYSYGAHLSAITGIGKEAFCSGKYTISYSSITECRIVKKYQTWSGDIWIIDLFYEDKKVGYDKFFPDEYFKIKENIESDTNTMISRQC